MIEVRKTAFFDFWFAALKDTTVQRRIQIRIDRLELGNHGDSKPIGEGVSELRIDLGPGYRVYFVQRGVQLIILLAGGTKRSQKKDIARAIELSKLV